MVVRNACSIGPNRAQGSIVKGMRTMFFLIQFANDIITVDDRCGGVECLCVHPSLPRS